MSKIENAAERNLNELELTSELSDAELEAVAGGKGGVGGGPGGGSTVPRWGWGYSPSSGWGFAFR